MLIKFCLQGLQKVMVALVILLLAELDSGTAHERSGDTSNYFIWDDG